MEELALKPPNPATRNPRLSRRRLALIALCLVAIGGLSFIAGLAWAARAAHAAEELPAPQAIAPSALDASPRPEAPKAGGAPNAAVKTVYPKKTELDFDGMGIEGQVKSPGEFYFQHRNEEKFDSLVKRRKEFHREMLRDAVLSR